MVEWCWWDSSLIWKTNWFPSVLWPLWFGHETCKNRLWNDILYVEWDVKPLYTTTRLVEMFYQCETCISSLRRIFVHDKILCIWAQHFAALCQYELLLPPKWLRFTQRLSLCLSVCSLASSCRNERYKDLSLDTEDNVEFWSHLRLDHEDPKLKNVNTRTTLPHC